MRQLNWLNRERNNQIEEERQLNQFKGEKNNQMEEEKLKVLKRETKNCAIIK